MAKTYVLGTVSIIFEDEYRTIIHQNSFDLDNSGHIASFVNGSRIELEDGSKTFIGTIKDVKHRIVVDQSNNYVESISVHCGQAYEVT